MKSFHAQNTGKESSGHAVRYETAMAPQLEQLFLSSGHNYFGHHGRSPSNHAQIAATELGCVAGRGLSGDRFFDYRPNYAGQITFFSAEVFEELQRTCGSPATTAATRRNVITRGLDLTTLIDRKFCLQGVWFHGAGECKPCYWMNEAIAPGSENWLRGRGGLRARILTDGILRPGAAHFVDEARSA